MGLPLWVKPSRLGSSVGIFKVERPRARLDPAVEAARRHDPRVIVEAHCDGLEVECSVIGNDEPRDLAAGPGRGRTPSGTTTRPSTSPAGWSCSSRRRSATRRSPASASSRPTSTARRGCTGLARCDFFVEPGGEVLVNELNTIPGFTETSVFAKLFEADGDRLPDLCDRLVALALERHETERGYEY